MIRFKFFVEDYMSTKQMSSAGTHNYESAVHRVWKYFSDTHEGRAPDVDEMHKELNDSKNNPSHPLHISNADKSEFAGKLANGTPDERERAHRTYNKNMKDAIPFVATMAEHPDFKDAWAEKHEAEHTGNKTYPLSDSALTSGLKEGSRAATGRADLIIHHPGNPNKSKRISLKRAGRHQAFSAGPESFHAIYSGAARKLNLANHISNNEHADIIERAGKIRNHLKNGNRLAAQLHLNRLHKQYGNKLLSAVHSEGYSGKSTFKTIEGTANYIGTVGGVNKENRIETVKQYVNRRMVGAGGSRLFTEPEVGGAKGFGRTLTVRSRQ